MLQNQTAVDVVRKHSVNAEPQNRNRAVNKSSLRMSTAAAWGNNPANGLNQGFPVAPTGQPTAGAWHAGYPTAGVPGGGVTVIVDSAGLRRRMLPPKAIGTIHLVFGVIYLVFVTVFVVSAPVPLYIGFVLLTAVAHLVAGGLTVASPLNNPSSSLVKYSLWASVASIAATGILIIILVFGFVSGLSNKSCSKWDSFDCISAKHQFTAILGFLMVFSLFVVFSSMMFTALRCKGCCPEPMGPFITVPAAGGPPMPSSFQGHAGQQNFYADNSDVSIFNTFQTHHDQEGSFGSNNPSESVDNASTDDPPSYSSCVLKSDI
ncbi:uncharacterized protein [Salminus brasiliensis]|uniref:uncharacterized protein n=1 Tax=Salminus brasiliensis TaxID=930266 RepID=UPI003B838166